MQKSSSFLINGVSNEPNQSAGIFLPIYSGPFVGSVPNARTYDFSLILMKTFPIRQKKPKFKSVEKKHLVHMSYCHVTTKF